MQSDIPRPPSYSVNSDNCVLHQRRSFDATRSLLCLSRSGFYKLLEKDPTFPRPVKDGTAKAARVYFLESEVAAWQQAQILASRSKAERE